MVVNRIDARLILLDNIKDPNNIDQILDELGFDGIDDGYPSDVTGNCGVAYGISSVDDEESYTFYVLITDAGPNKVSVIKTLREITGLGLKECVEIFDSWKGSSMQRSAAIKRDVCKWEAKDIMERLDKVGVKTISIDEHGKGWTKL